MNQQLQEEIQQRIAAFSQEITAILSAAVAASISDALGGSSVGVKRGPGRPPNAAGAKRGPGRPPNARAVDVDTVLAEIKRGGGRRSEELAKSLRTKTKWIASSLKKLVVDKKVKTTGLARGTKYTAS